MKTIKMFRILMFVLLLIPSICNSQDFHKEKKTYFSLEGGGSGIIASANVGHTLFTRKRVKAIFQAGLGWNPESAESDLPFNVPVQLTGNFGKNNFYVEAGAGSTLIFKSSLESADKEDLKTLLYVSPIFGFRYEKEKWFCRAFGCPMFNVTGEHLQDDVTKDFIKFGVAIGARF